MACSDQLVDGAWSTHWSAPPPASVRWISLARSSGTYLRYREKLAKPDVLILDDVGMRKLTATEAQDLCEILEERSFGKSTVFTTQLPLEHWAEVIADPVIADAIRDRLQHTALILTITGGATYCTAFGGFRLGSTPTWSTNTSENGSVSQVVGGAPAQRKVCVGGASGGG